MSTLHSDGLHGDYHMKKNEDRKIAEQTFLGDRGRITNKETRQKAWDSPGDCGALEEA